LGKKSKELLHRVRRSLATAVPYLNSLKSPHIASHLIVFQGTLSGCWKDLLAFKSVRLMAADGGRKVVVASYHHPLLKWLFFVQLLISLQRQRLF